jgi:CTP synthase (UTP-ammonia lyase)
MPQAGHMEEDPDNEFPLLVLASCPVDYRAPGDPRLSGGLQIEITAGTLAYAVYQRSSVKEKFSCNYELNPKYRPVLEKAGLKFSGLGRAGEARIAELPGKAFYMGTGFLPQLSSSPQNPHPLVVAFLQATLK